MLLKKGHHKNLQNSTSYYPKHSSNVVEKCIQFNCLFASSVVSLFGGLLYIEFLISFKTVLQGQFDILTLQGSFIPATPEGTDRVGALSIKFALGDEMVAGGQVAGPLRAATSVMVKCYTEYMKLLYINPFHYQN